MNITNGNKLYRRSVCGKELPKAKSVRHHIEIKLSFFRSNYFKGLKMIHKDKPKYWAQNYVKLKSLLMSP